MGEGGKTALPMFGLFMEKVMKDPAYNYLRGEFPRHLKGLHDRPYMCHTKYVPRDTIDSLAIHQDSTLHLDVLLPDELKVME